MPHSDHLQNVKYNCLQVFKIEKIKKKGGKNHKLESELSFWYIIAHKCIIKVFFFFFFPKK